MGSFNCINLLEKEKKLLKKVLPKRFSKHIAILLTTEDLPSNKYVKLKVELLKSLGIDVVLTNKQDASAEFIFNWIVENNQDESCFGIIVQYPISANNRETVSNLIEPCKDMDALSAYWIKEQLQEKLDDCLLAPTAYGCLEIIKEQKKEGPVLVVGDSLLTGAPIRRILSGEGFLVWSCTEKTKWERKKTLVEKAKIIVTTVGRSNVIDEEWITPDHLVIDFGRRYLDGKALGDINLRRINKQSTYTSVYKSTGYATLAGILRNIRIKIKGIVIHE